MPAPVAIEKKQSEEETAIGKNNEGKKLGLQEREVLSRQTAARNDFVEQDGELVRPVIHVLLVAHELLNRLLESVAVAPADGRRCLVRGHAPR